MHGFFSSGSIPANQYKIPHIQCFSVFLCSFADAFDWMPVLTGENACLDASSPCVPLTPGEQSYWRYPSLTLTFEAHNNQLLRRTDAAVVIFCLTESSKRSFHSQLKGHGLCNPADDDKLWVFSSLWHLHNWFTWSHSSTCEQTLAAVCFSFAVLVLRRDIYRPPPQNTGRFKQVKAAKTSAWDHLFSMRPRNGTSSGRKTTTSPGLHIATKR